jgi:flagellar motor switch protein FliM
MRGWCAPQGEGNDGVLGQFRAISLEIGTQIGRYELRVTEEGAMIVTKMEDEQASANAGPLGVRLDLGEIEISLDELLTLRAGSSIELVTDGPVRCFLRVGATTFAAGEIVVSGEYLTVRVTEIVHGE